MSQSQENFAAKLAWRHRAGWLFAAVCRTATWASMVFLAVILMVILMKGWPRLTPGFLTRFDSYRPEAAGMLAGILGSFWLIGCTAAICVPIGIGAAIYLEEYARPNRLTRFIQLNISNLAGVPSIVYGILGFTAFVRMFGMPRTTFVLTLGFADLRVPLPFGRSVIAGAMTLALLCLPVVIIASQEALRSVPASLRHAALALGATKWQTISRQVLPAAMPGILTGVILALSRALGETAPLAVLGAATFITFAPGRLNSLSDVGQHPERLLMVPFDQFTAMPLQIYNWVNEQSRDFQQQVSAAGIIVLLAILVLMNGTAIVIRQHFQRKIRW
jgi:phosphate transport system permease protein